MSAGGSSGATPKGRLMKAVDMMTYPVVASAPTATLRDIAAQMLSGGFSGVPIADPEGRILGLVTEFDIISAIRAGKAIETTTAQEVMTKEVATVDISTSLEDVMARMEEMHVLRLPVTDGGCLVGVISRPDVLKAFVEPNFMMFG